MLQSIFNAARNSLAGVAAAARNEGSFQVELAVCVVLLPLGLWLGGTGVERALLVSSVLIVRGVCALKPGIAGLSENIRVRSIVGRFLEHSRVFYFQNGGSDEVYLASADWMDRNFFRRIELCFPVLDPALKRRVIREGLQPYLDDNCQAWAMAADGSYEQLKPRRRRRSAQEELLFTLGTPT